MRCTLKLNHTNVFIVITQHARKKSISNHEKNCSFKNKTSISVKNVITKYQQSTTSPRNHFDCGASTKLNHTNADIVITKLPEKTT